MKIERRENNEWKDMTRVLRYENIKEGKEIKLGELKFDDSVGKIVIGGKDGFKRLCYPNHAEYISYKDGMMVIDGNAWGSYGVWWVYYYKGEEKVYLKYRDIKSVKLDFDDRVWSLGKIEISEDGKLVLVKGYDRIIGKEIYFACYDYIREIKYIRMEDICRWIFLKNCGEGIGMTGEGQNVMLTMGWCYSPKTNIEFEIKVMKKVVDVLGIKKCLVHRKLGIGKINDYEKEVITECYKMGVEVIGEVGKVNREGKIEKEIDGNSEI